MGQSFDRQGQSDVCFGSSVTEVAKSRTAAVVRFAPEQRDELASFFMGFPESQRSRTTYNTSGACIAAKATTQCPLWVIRVRGDQSGAGALSALPPKADIASLPRYVCFVPKADIRIAARRTAIQSLRWRASETVRGSSDRSLLPSCY